MAQERVTIEGELNDGTMPPEIVPEELPEVKIRETVTRDLPGRKVTIHRIANPGLPDPRPRLPENPNLTEAEREAFLNSDEVRQWQENAKEMMHLVVSATVIDNKATYLQWWYEGKEYQGWSQVNFNHLTGFTTCQKGNKKFVTMILNSNLKSEQLPEGSKYQIPADLLQGEAGYRVIKGDAENPEAYEALTALHELYKTDSQRLIQAYEQREQKRKEQEEQRRLNPEKKKDIVLHYWKIEKKGDDR